MIARVVRSWGLLAVSVVALHCGADSSSTLLVAEQSGQRLAGRFAIEGRAMEFSARRADALAGDVQIDIGALRYDLHYDFEARDGGRAVVTDGRGGAIERASQPMLLAAIEALTRYLGPSQADWPLHEQMLPAALSLLRDSGGMPLERSTFDLGPKHVTASEDSLEVDKSLRDDGIGCIKRGVWYAVSYDYGDTTVIDDVVEAGVFECNGQCGPTCNQLQPWRMWTLDCLEHDSCCNVTSDDSCWTPLGECGDEYDAAMGDFLRGFDPFRRHCGG